jgi:hypothetical protein
MVNSVKFIKVITIIILITGITLTDYALWNIAHSNLVVTFIFIFFLVPSMPIVWTVMLFKDLDNKEKEDLDIK